MTGARILVVDDETQLRRALKRSLEGHGYAVREAEDGESALREFDAFKPDVLLLDLMLPDTTGVDICRELRRKYETPIIVLSVVGDEKAKVAALDEGADDYLTKPFGMDELLARVRVALRRGSTTRPQSGVITTGELSIDLERRTVHVLDVFAERRLNHHAEVTGGVLAEECGTMLSNFFAMRRAQQKAQ